MSISELADSCKVSDSTVFRFCQKLGVGGYQEFKTLLSLGIREDKDTAGEGEAEKYNENATPFMRRAAGILETDVEALRETCAAVRGEDIKEVVGLLHEARRIAFFGAGVSLPVRHAGSQPVYPDYEQGELRSGYTFAGPCRRLFCSLGMRR